LGWGRRLGADGEKISFRNLILFFLRLAIDIDKPLLNPPLRRGP
jgi:hypothetical protein